MGPSAGWLLPPVLLLTAGAVALILVWPRLRQQPSNGRLVIEAFLAALMTIAVFSAGWLFLLSIGARW